MVAMATVAAMMTATTLRQRACDRGDDGGDGGDDGNGCGTAAMAAMADGVDGAVCFLLAGWTGCLARRRMDGMGFYLG